MLIRRQLRRSRAVDALMVSPTGQVGVAHAGNAVKPDEPYLGERLERRLDVVRRDTREVTKDEEAELIGVRDQPPLVVCLSDQADPEAELAISKLADFAVLQGLGLDGPDPRQTLTTPPIPPIPRSRSGHQSRRKGAATMAIARHRAHVRRPPEPLEPRPAAPADYVLTRGGCGPSLRSILEAVPPGPAADFAVGWPEYDPPKPLEIAHCIATVPVQIPLSARDTPSTLKTTQKRRTDG